MKTSLSKLYFLWFLTELSISSAILLPFYFLHHITEQQVFAMIAIYQVSILLAEIPTGLIASKFWEKTSIILGFFCSALFYILIPFTSSFTGFLLLQILSAVSVAFLSGSLSTFINDFCKTYAYSFVDIKSTYKIFTLTTGIISTIIWWLLLYYGYTFVFFLQASFYLWAILLIWTIHINPRHEFTESQFFKILKISVRTISEKNILIPILFVFSFLSIEAWVYLSFQSEYINTLGLNVQYLGIFLSLFLVVSMLFTQILPKKKWVLHPYFLIAIGAIFIVVSYVHILFWSVATLFLLYLTQVIRPMDIPIEERILSKIRDNSWSTVLSLIWFFERVVFLIITAVMNIFAINWIHAILYFSIIFTTLFIGIIAIHPYKHTES